jgi:hypothetical protein
VETSGSSVGVVMDVKSLLSFRGARCANPESRSYHLEILRCAIAHHS